jgi:hypothetical protein
MYDAFLVSHQFEAFRGVPPFINEMKMATNLLFPNNGLDLKYNKPRVWSIHNFLNSQFHPYRSIAFCTSVEVSRSPKGGTNEERT